MAQDEHDAVNDEVPYSRWEDFKERLMTEWRRDDFGRHTIYWSVIAIVGVFGYMLLVRLGQVLGVLG